MAKKGQMVGTTMIIVGVMFVIIVFGGGLFKGFSIIENQCFGNPSIGSIQDQNDANYISISYFTAPISLGVSQSGSNGISDVYLYAAASGSNGHVKAALYHTINGVPTLEAQTDAIEIDTNFQWWDIPVTYQGYSAIQPITAGDQYGLAILGDVPINVMINVGTGLRDHNYYGGFSAGFPQTFTGEGPDPTGAMTIDAGAIHPVYTPMPTGSGQPVQYLTINQIGQGTINPSLNNDAEAIGSSFSLGATAANGWHFNYWQFSDGTANNANAYFTYTFQHTVVVTAVFTANATPTPTATNGGGGGGGGGGNIWQQLADWINGFIQQMIDLFKSLFGMLTLLFGGL